MYAQMAMDAQEWDNRLYNSHRFGNQIGVCHCSKEQHIVAQHQDADILIGCEGVALQCSHDEVMKCLASVIVHGCFCQILDRTFACASF